MSEREFDFDVKYSNNAKMKIAFLGEGAGRMREKVFRETFGILKRRSFKSMENDADELFSNGFISCESFGFSDGEYTRLGNAASETDAFLAVVAAEDIERLPKISLALSGKGYFRLIFIVGESDALTFIDEDAVSCLRVSEEALAKALSDFCITIYNPGFISLDCCDIKGVVGTGRIHRIARVEANDKETLVEMLDSSESLDGELDGAGGASYAILTIYLNESCELAIAEKIMNFIGCLNIENAIYGIQFLPKESFGDKIEISIIYSEEKGKV